MSTLYDEFSSDRISPHEACPGENPCVVQIFVFRGDDCLGWDCFCKDRVSIGRSADADLMLDHQDVLQIHGHISIDHDQVVYESCDSPTIELGPLDALEIGPFILKIKPKKNIRPGIRIQLGVDQTVDIFMDEPEENTDKLETDEEPDNNVNTDFIETLSPPEEEEPADDWTPGPMETEKVQGHTLDVSAILRCLDEEDDDEDEDEAEAGFSLKEKVTGVNDASCRAEHAPVSLKADLLLEVVRSRGDAVVDVSFLKRKQRYYINTDSGRFCLAENKNADKNYYYFDKTTNILLQTGETLIRRAGSKGKIHNKKKGIYRDDIPLGSTVILWNGPFEYHLRRVCPMQSPQVPQEKKKDKEFARHFYKSVLFHVIVLTLLGMFPSYRPEVEDIEPRFAQVDTAEFEELQKRLQPPPPPPEPKPELTRPKEKKAVKVKAKKEVKKARSRKKVAVSRSPKAGGGHGKGNIKNRNINQAGILSMLGDNIGLKPQDAMAAVTNLDAVTASPNTGARFKVGGIVGKLGSGKIEIPKAGMVSTKGKTQVLKSAGLGGDGNIAALERGSTGDGEVMAMVSAEMNRTVRIKGGMSREAVKKIIDQHLDEITHCYETALVANPSLMGKVVFEWKILLSGHVGEVRIKSSTINSSEIHGCIQSAIRSWVFPQPKGAEVVVSYPFIFDIVGF